MAMWSSETSTAVVEHARDPVRAKLIEPPFGRSHLRNWWAPPFLEADGPLAGDDRKGLAGGGERAQDLNRPEGRNWHFSRISARSTLDIKSQ